MTINANNELERSLARVVLVGLALLLIAESAQAQSTGFTYQGRLADAGNPADGLYEMQFKLFDTATVGTGIQHGSAITDSAVQVTNGVFTVQLDFGTGIFDGSARFLEIGIRPAGSADPFTTLSPRQPISSSPYAVRSATAGSADIATNAGQLGGMSPSGFIQNTNTQQPATSFNVSGTGTANILNAATQFNLNGNRVLTVNGGLSPTSNTFVGVNAGNTSTTGDSNSFFGFNAGVFNTTGFGNSFFGSSAGAANTTGGGNSFFGISAGGANTTGGSNSFVGNSAGLRNTTGNGNSFFGEGAGFRNTTANGNSFFGTSAGFSNTTGQQNAFFGVSAGTSNVTGTGNTFIGTGANFDVINPTGDNNTLLGVNAVVISGVNNGTALGAGARVSTSNTIVLGKSIDTVQIPGTLSMTGTLTASIFNATTQFSLGGSRILSNSGLDNLFAGIGAGAVNTGFSNSFFGSNAGLSNTTGATNAFIGKSAGRLNTTGSGNSFFGANAGSGNTTGGTNSFFGFGAGSNNTTGERNTFVGETSGNNNTTGVNNTFIGTAAGNPSTATQVNNSTAIGFGATVSTSNTVVIGRTTETTQIPGKLVTSKIVMGAGPVESGGVAQTFDTGSIQGIFAANLVLYDIDDILASPVHLCIRSTSLGGFGGEALARCSSSSSPSQYKTNLQPFLGGLDVINRLKPLTFNWRGDGRRDFGLNAEDVAEVAPLLVNRNEKGEVEDVNESSFNVLFINAFKEQQQQIKILQQHIESLKKIVCLDHPDAPVCK